MSSIKAESTGQSRARSRHLEGHQDITTAPPGESVAAPQKITPLYIERDGVAGRRPSARVTGSPTAPGVTLPEPGAPGAVPQAPSRPTVESAQPGRPQAATGGVTGPQMVSGVSAVNSTTTPYSVPPDAEQVEGSLWEKIGAGVGIFFLAPFYLVFALIALIPSLIAGAIEGPKEDQPDGSGTFMFGFAEMYRKIMYSFGWLVQKPMELLTQTVSNPRGVFFVDRSTDPNNTIITVRIRLTGDAGDITRVKALEGAIENHLAIPGYRVNVEFVDRDGDDVNTVEINRDVWSSVYDWNPYDNDDQIDAMDAYMMAHETMHILGLRDEYDVSQHFTNPGMDDLHRWGVFFSRLVQPELPADSDQGIMRYSSRKPLPRHYEEVLG